MSMYSKNELEEAKISITSMIVKCEKAIQKLSDRPSQNTLLIRRINALKLSVKLIDKELLNLVSNDN